MAETDFFNKRSGFPPNYKYMVKNEDHFVVITNFLDHICLYKKVGEKITVERF